MSAEQAPLSPRSPSGKRRKLPALLALAAVPLLAVAVYLIVVVLRFSGDNPVIYEDDARHFKYGSIGTEAEGGIPYWVWRAMAGLFHQEMDAVGYIFFGFTYEDDEAGHPYDLPVGVSRRRIGGIDRVGFNCAVCHAGTFRERRELPAVVVPGAPANQLDLGRFYRFLFAAAVDERFSPPVMLDMMERVGAEFDWADRLVYRYLVIPQARDRILRWRHRLLPLLERQPAWGGGRADLIHLVDALVLDQPVYALTEEELLGTADIPSIWMQGPRTELNGHWGGNSRRLDERIRFDALAIGATPETLDRPALERVRRYLAGLRPPSNPQLEQVDVALARRGRAIYDAQCAECHGFWEGTYAFEGARLGGIEAAERIGTDPARAAAFTERVAKGLAERFADRGNFSMAGFKSTRGYVNLPLDGLWLRAPYLHNGSVPTLSDLLEPPGRRPVNFLRGNNLLNYEQGGFAGSACSPDRLYQRYFCFDTRLAGNGNGGHTYGTALPAPDKRALLEHLRSF